MLVGYPSPSLISDNTPDTFHFLTKLSSQNIKYHTMISFYVKSLFTNIPTSFTTQLILDNIFKNDKEWKGLSRNRLKKLLTWSTQNTTFQFDNKFYKQLDGVAVGSPIGSLMTDVIMNYVIDKALEITPQLHRPASSADTWMTVLPPSLNQPLLTSFSIT